jgi:lambda repressor-like predicted transcriptional regulator
MAPTGVELQRWSKKAREATERRDTLIRQMRAEGSTLRSIAEAAGLSHTAIVKIVSRTHSSPPETAL